MDVDAAVCDAEEVPRSDDADALCPQNALLSPVCALTCGHHPKPLGAVRLPACLQHR